MVKLLSIFALTAVLMYGRAGEPPYRAITIAGVENAFAVGTNLFSGSAPEGDEAFAALKKLGIKTIITVDGAKPDVERAEKFGLKYIHLPHGYDGIPAKVEAQLVKAAEVSEGPIYLHCHHGKHRGPAAVAVVCMAREGWPAMQAEQWLVAAGTATNYAGLYKSVREFRPPSAQELSAVSTNFPSKVEVSSLVDAMVEIDNAFDKLKEIRAAGYKAPSKNPDLDPANEALILWEHFRELQRAPQTKSRPALFAESLMKAETEAKQLENALRSKDHRRADEAFDAVRNQCAACHRQFRDAAPTQRTNLK